MFAIEVKNLTRDYRVAERNAGFLRHLLHRQYRTIRAVDGVSFGIEQGQLVGFIGPNGAGKSTAIKMMTGILTPTAGEIRVLGNVPHQRRRENAGKIGVVFGQRSQLWWDLPLTDTFLLLKKMYNIPNEVYRRNMADFERRLELSAFIKQPVRQLSLGQRMRADLAASLLHDPEILFLDEPTIGMDVVVKKQLREFILEANRQRGVTVILTTHDMRDIEEICGRLLMIDKGRLVLDMPVSELRGRLGGAVRITVDFEATPPEEPPLHCTLERREGCRCVYLLDAAQTSPGRFVAELASRHRVQDISLRQPEIEDIIRDIYSGEIPLSACRS